MSGRTRMIVTVPHDHVVAAAVRVIIVPRLVIVVRRIRTMIVRPRVIVLRARRPRRDEGDRYDGRRMPAHGPVSAMLQD